MFRKMAWYSDSGGDVSAVETEGNMLQRLWSEYTIFNF